VGKYLGRALILGHSISMSYYNNTIGLVA